MTPVSKKVATREAGILQKASVLVLRCHGLGNNRAVDLKQTVEAALTKEGDETKKEVDEVNENVKKRTKVTRWLVDPKVLSKPNAVQGWAKAYLKTEAVSCHRAFGKSAYLVPLERVDVVDAKLEEMAAELKKRAGEVADVWDEEVAKEAVLQGPLFNGREYPTAADVRRAYAIEWSYVSFDAPDNLKDVSAAAFKKATKAYERRCTDAFAETKLVMREALQQIVNEFKDRVTPGPDGKPKGYRNTVLDDMLEFLNTYPFRNLAGDDDLTKVTATLAKLTKGLTAEQLKENETVRTKVLGQIEKAATALDGLVETGRRGLRFGSLGDGE